MSITDKIKAFWRKVPKPMRSAWITAWVVFTGTLLTIAVNLLPQLMDAITNKDFQPFFDSLSKSASLALAALLAFVCGIVNGLYRWIRPIEQAYRTDPPAPPA